MQSASKHLGNQISHRMGNYELQYKTMNGRAVYRKYSETWGSAFLYYDFVSSTKKYWVIGADLGTPDVNLYAPSGVVDATQVRSVSMHTSQTLTHRAQIGPLWHVADPEHHKFVANPSISLVCRQTTDGSSGGESADSSASDGAASRCGETQWRMPYAPLARILTPAAHPPPPSLQWQWLQCWCHRRWPVHRLSGYWAHGATEEEALSSQRGVRARPGTGNGAASRNGRAPDLSEGSRPGTLLNKAAMFIRRAVFSGVGFYTE
jgi:hypothetical protein